MGEEIEIQTSSDMAVIRAREAKRVFEQETLAELARLRAEIELLKQNQPEVK